MSSKRSRRAFSVLLGGGVGLLLVAGAEIGLRLAGVQAGGESFYFERLGERILEPGMYESHPERFFALRANYRYSEHHAGPNALGAWPFRGRPLEPAPADLWRVCVFGDSCAYGLPLPPNQALPARLADELARSRPRSATLVANLGVPGYSTVQIRSLVEETLEHFQPDEVVLYPAAWNDQAPALGPSDVELRDRSKGLLERSALLSALRSRSQGANPEPIPEGTESTGPRVPEEAVEGEVRAMIRACRERGVGVIVIVPPHTPDTRSTHARMWRDADTVRRAATAEGARVVDGQAVFEASGMAADDFFADLVHPAPPGAGALALEVASLLTPPPVTTSDHPLRIVAVSPDSAPELGDMTVTIELDGWSEGAALPAVTIGGAMLLGLEAAGPNSVRGTLPHLAPGPGAIVVQTATACAEAPTLPVDIRAPRVEVLDAAARRLRITSRPGDIGRVFATRARRESRKWSSRGAQWIEEASFVPSQLKLKLGDDGSAEGVFPGLDGEGPFYLQALIQPRGEPEGSDFAVWSELAVLP